MRINNPSFEIWQQGPGISGVYKQVERVGRVCYKSEDHTTADSARPFVERMIKSEHLAMLEHGSVYLLFDIKPNDERGNGGERPWEFYAGTLDAIGAVVCLDLASVHLYECLAEVQSYAGAFDVKVAAVAALVESVKESVGLLFLQSDAGILYLDDGILLVLAHDEGDGAAIEGILHGVGEQVGNHLVEVDAVYPYRQLAIGIVEARIFLERECDVALFCIETVERYDAVQEFLELGFLAVQMHLVLVYLSLVEYLVHQKQQALGVAVDGIDILFAFGIRDSCLQLVERSHNQCQR